MENAIYYPASSRNGAERIAVPASHVNRDQNGSIKKETLERSIGDNLTGNIH